MNDSEFLILAGSISDGNPVDWAELETRVGPEAQPRLRGLQLVERIGRAFDDPQDRFPNVDLLAQTIGETLTLAGDSGPGRSEPVLRKWGDLEIRERLGAGSFGEVYRAYDRRLDAEVALKLMAPRLLSGAFGERFLDEARLLARIKHPNIVTVHGAARHEGRVGFWMELVRGSTLSALLDENGAFGPREAMLIGIDLCRAASAMHEAGVLHRDIKGQNAMRQEGGRLLLMDLGGAIELSSLDREGRWGTGTPLYMAPEVLLGSAPSVQSDVYSMGVLLYHLVTGSFPLQAGSLDTLREIHRSGIPKLLRDARSDLPERFVRVVERAIAPKPESRFRTMGEMGRALTDALGLETTAAIDPPRRTSFPGLAALVLVLAAAILGVLIWAVSPPGGEPAAVTTADSFTVDAAFVRVRDDGRRVPLQSGDRLALGDGLLLEIESTSPSYVYVVNEDDRGRAFALFPLPASSLQNPLSPNARHRLPGEKAWGVDSVGGRERLLVVVTTERMVEFEAELNRLPRPQIGQQARPISEAARASLTRGLGSLIDLPEDPDPVPAASLFTLAARIGRAPTAGRDLWIRTFEFENPGY